MSCSRKGELMSPIKLCKAITIIGYIILAIVTAIIILITVTMKGERKHERKKS